MNGRQRSRWQIGFVVLSTAMLGQVLVGATDASAQATRTWVSGVGDDANPCSRTAPCKTFAGAISKTAAGGEISVLDPGGYGAVTITKSITISGNGNESSILSSGTSGILVNGANIVVRIRGIEINGAGGTLGINGIRFIQGRALIVDDVDVYGHSQAGLTMTAPGRLVVRNSRFDNNGVAGISLATTGTPAGLVRATVEGVNMDLNGTGLFSGANARVTVRDCTASNNTVAGLSATNGGIVADACTVQGNPTGILSQNSSAVRVQRTAVVDNATGLSATGGSQLLSGGGNTVEGNGTNGSFNGSYTPV